MPDLNYDTPALKAEMLDTASFWLDTVGVDGFRLDAVLYIDEDGAQLQNTPETLQFWHDFNAHVKSVEPDAFSVGEAWTSTSVVQQYVSDDRLDICFEFDLAGTILGAVNGATAVSLASKASQVSSIYPFLQFGTFLTNHDMDRSFDVLGQDEGRARTAAGIYLALPGVPFVYYGEELGMTGTGAHENIRTPMQWTAGSQAGFTTGTPWHPVNSNYLARNVAVEAADPGSLLSWYRKLVRARMESSALRRGEFLGVGSSSTSVLAFMRRDGDHTVLCLANTAAAARFGVTVVGNESTLPAGDHTLVNLLDPADVLQVTVGASHELEGLDLDAHEVALYEFRDTTGVSPGTGLQVGPRLLGSLPNPFTPPTNIRFELPARARVRVAVYDLQGREIAVLVDGEQAEGTHDAAWDGTDRRGRAMSAGIYFVRLEAAGETRLSKMMLVR